MPLRIALLGCGPLGRRYTDVVTAQGSTVFVVFDSDSEAAASLAAEVGARLAPSLRDAVTAVGVDVVLVCLDGEERIAAIEAAAAALRPVFDALPVAGSSLAALRGAHDAGVVVGLDLRRRHDPGVREVVDVARSVQVGAIGTCSIVDRDEAVSFEESLVHDLDLARYLTGSDIDRVAGVRNVGSTMLLLTHVNGAITSIENSRLAPAGPELRVEVAGVLGTVSNGPNLQSVRSGAVVETADGQWRRRRNSDAQERTLTAQWVSFVGDVGVGAPTEIVVDADLAQVAARAALRALDEGRTVGVAELLSTS